MDKLIKVGFLISYDYIYLKESLPRVYDYADEISLAIDIDNKTWNGGDIFIPESFYGWIESFDSDNKISIYKNSFYMPSLSPIECETRERNMLADFMGKGGWHIQVDTDEYFLDFGGFVNYLKSLDITQKIQVCARLFVMVKEDENGFFVVFPGEPFNCATNNPDYNYARGIADFDVAIYTDFYALHQSLARREDEISFKFKNWGHTKDFNGDGYFQLWKAINKTTYKYIKSFHFLDGWKWKYMEYFETKNMTELSERINHYLQENMKAELKANKLKVKDFIPVALYKIKGLIKKRID